MGEWKEKAIDEVATLAKRQWRVGGEKLPYLGLEHIAEGELRLTGIGSSTEVSSQKYLFGPDSFLFGKLRPYFRKVYRPNFDGICSTDIWVVEATKGNSLDFLFYFFANQDFVDFTYSGASGTRMPRADWNFVAKSKWPIPPLPEQRAIASVLSSLDAKIDLLHRQNKTLEGMAEALFRQWFVEKAEEEWEEMRLDQFSTVGIGRTPPRKEQHWFSTESNDVKWISIKDMAAEGPFIFSTAEYLTQEAVERYRVPVIPKDTVVLSFKMTLGRVKITTDEMLSNEAIAHFRINPDSHVTKEFLYLGLKTYQYETLGSTSTIVDSINSGMINGMVLQIPPEPFMDRFMAQCGPWYEKIRSNQVQIHTLSALRDTLLPKLMSGEVRVEATYQTQVQ